MRPSRWSLFWVVVLSFVVALLLSVYPVPIALRWWRPEFVLLVTIFWVSVYPLTFSLLLLVLVGLLQDLLEGVPLGEHSLSLVIIAYICIMSYQRVRNFSLLKETGWVFILVGLAQLPTNWVQSMAGRPLSGLMFLVPAAVSALVWPLVRMALSQVSRPYTLDE